MIFSPFNYGPTALMVVCSFFAGGYMATRHAQKVQDAKDKAAEVSVLQAWVSEGKKAAESAANIASAMSAARASIAAIEPKTLWRVQETTRVIQEHPELAACLQPADVQRMHADAVRESAAAADTARRHYDRGLAALRGAGARSRPDHE